MEQGNRVDEAGVNRTVRVCFIGGAIYSRPLDPTSEKKFSLLAERAEIFVIGFSADMVPRSFRQHARFYLLPRLPLPVLRYAEMIILGTLLAIWLVLRKGVQVIVAQSPYEGCAGALAKTLAAAAGRRVALVVESHGDFEESLFLQRRVRGAGLYRLVMTRAARYTIWRADVLRGVSSSTCAQLERWAPGKPIVRFPAWTDIDVFLGEGEAASHAEREPLLLFAGVVTPVKGIHHLLEAFGRVARDFPRAQLLLVGPEPDRDYGAQLRRQVARLDLDGRVVFHGAVSQRELAGTMARARALILPSVSEGLGRVILEAMACGTPVIGSSVGGIPDLIEDGVTGFLVPPGDVEALAERMSRVLKQPEEAASMGRRARELARQRFSHAAYRRSYERLFHLALFTVGISDGVSSR